MHHNVSDIEFLLTLCIAAVFVFACIAMQKPVINYYLKFHRLLLQQELAVSRQADKLLLSLFIAFKEFKT